MDMPYTINEQLKALHKQLEPMNKISTINEQLKVLRKQSESYDYAKIVKQSIRSSSTSQLLEIQRQTIPADFWKFQEDNAELFGSIKVILNTITAAKIAASCIGFLKLNSDMQELLPMELFQKYRSAMAKISDSTATMLLNTDDFSYNNDTKLYCDNITGSVVSPTILNIISSAAECFEDLSDDDMISFYRYIVVAPMMGLNHPVGKKIETIVKEQLCSQIQEITNVSLYRIRKKPKGSSPLLEDEMRRPPCKITIHGRFNMPGVSHFYVADSEEGAKTECDKHRKSQEYQLETFKNNRPVKIVSIEDGMNSFISYCQFPFTSKKSVIHPEYLIPCFFAECCKINGIDGLKYKGSPLYSNYVFWSDQHFDSLSSAVIKL